MNDQDEYSFVDASHYSVKSYTFEASEGQADRAREAALSFRKKYPNYNAATSVCTDYALSVLHAALPSSDLSLLSRVPSVLQRQLDELLRTGRISASRWTTNRATSTRRTFRRSRPIPIRQNSLLRHRRALRPTSRAPCILRSENSWVSSPIDRRMKRRLDDTWQRSRLMGEVRDSAETMPRHGPVCLRPGAPPALFNNSRGR